MTNDRLDDSEAEELLAGRRPAGRLDLAGLAEVAAMLHASREVEPPPPMSPRLVAEVRGRSRRHPAPSRPGRVTRLPVDERRPRRRRAFVSASVAAALVVGAALVAPAVDDPGGLDAVVGDSEQERGLEDGRPAGSPPSVVTPPPSPTTAARERPAPTAPAPPVASPRTVPDHRHRGGERVVEPRGSEWLDSMFDSYFERYRRGRRGTSRDGHDGWDPDWETRRSPGRDGDGTADPFGDPGHGADAVVGPGPQADN